MPFYPATLYQSPPDSGSNDGALPTTYEYGWTKYDNLTPAQVVAFQSFPQDLTLYLKNQKWLAEIVTQPATVTISGVATTLQIAMDDRSQARVDKLSRKWAANATAVIAFIDATGKYYNINNVAVTAIDNVITNYVEKLFTTCATIQSSISATPPTITTRKQVDAAIAAVAPGSPSAINPSPT